MKGDGIWTESMVGDTSKSKSTGSSKPIFPSYARRYLTKRPRKGTRWVCFRTSKGRCQSVLDRHVPIELCGGPHVRSTGDIGTFKIKKEESSAAGVRGIKAIVV